MPKVRKTRVRKNADPDRRRRQRFSYDEKQELRQIARQNPGWKQAELAAWFFERFKKPITQATLSEVLRSEYAHLDDLKIRSTDLQRFRKLKAQWPDLEEALFEVQQRFQHQRITVTGDIFRSCATRLWKEISCYQGQPVPTFTNGWLDGF